MTEPIEVVLWVATAALDTDFTAKPIDVYPPSQWYPLGYVLNLTDTILRMRYRNGRDRAELAKPSELAHLFGTPTRACPPGICSTCPIPVARGPASGLGSRVASWSSPDCGDLERQEHGGNSPTDVSRWGHHSQVSSDRLAADQPVDRQGPPKLVAARPA